MSTQLADSKRRQLKWRFAIGVGTALAAFFLMLSFAAVLATDIDSDTQRRLSELLGDQEAARALARGANGLTHRRATVELVVALVVAAGATGVWFPALQQLKREVLETAPLVGGVVLSMPAAFVIWGIATGLAHVVFN